MNHSLEKNIIKIIRIEELISVRNESNTTNTYNNPENYLWVKNTKWPFQTFKLLSKVTGISAFPDKNLKGWISVLKNRGKGFKKKIGLFFKLPFQSKKSLPINTDFYFDKINFGILLYVNNTQPKVIKFNQIDNFDYAKQKLQNEFNSQTIANKIVHTNVKVPLTHNFFANKNLVYFEQNLIVAKDLHYLPKNKIESVYDHVFDFMFLFYTFFGISATPIKNHNYLENIKIEDYLSHLDFGKAIIRKYKEIAAQNKRIFFGKIHGDLSPNNILMDKTKKIWIIDWGESEDDYLTKDFKYHEHSSSYLYEKIVIHYNFEKEQLYTLKEQFFIQDYDEISKIIYHQIIKKNEIPYFNSKVNNCIKRLSQYI